MATASPAARDDAFTASPKEADAGVDVHAGSRWSSSEAVDMGTDLYRVADKPLLRYGTAVLLVAAAFALSVLFRSQLIPYPFMLFFGVVVGTAFLAGLGPALVATALSVLAVEFLFFQPVNTLKIHNVQDAIAIVIFGGVALLISWLADRTESSREELLAQRKEAQAMALRALLLSEASRLIAEAPRYEEGLQELTELLVREVADYAVAYAVADEVLRRLAVAHADESQREVVQRLLQLRQPTLEDDYGIGAAMRTGEPVLTREVDPSSLEPPGEGQQENLELLRELELISMILLPLRARGHLVGGLALVSSSYSGRRFDEQDLEFAQELGARIAVTLDNARLLAEAQAATRARERVMTVVAHDLRNPLNLVMGAAELLTNPDADFSRTTAGGMLKRATREAGDLIEDLLDVSRMERGEFKICPEPVPVTEILRQVESSAEVVAREKQVELEVRCTVDGASVHADQSRVHRIFSNLLDNAVEYSPPGGRVLLSARADNEHVVFSVVDGGPGIPQKDLPYVFEQFWQGETRKKGVGLGLAIVRGIVEAHGGRVWVESTDGEGASFSFTLPTPPGSPRDSRR